MKELVPSEIIEKRIFILRGHKVMIDRDLAELYAEFFSEFDLKPVA